MDDCGSVVRVVLLGNTCFFRDAFVTVCVCFLLDLVLALLRSSPFVFIDCLLVLNKIRLDFYVLRLCSKIDNCIERVHKTLKRETHY